ncbi:MAG: rod shape-determining protein MreC [Bacteroidales bacterium]|jgi:rod shape-determining protein MreC|nr:rod shape-determining protein MreC [Bacteroidales bacterium]
MRGLLWLLKKYNYILVFILLEIIALVLVSNHNLYQHSKLVNLNREISGRLYERIEGAREYLLLKNNNDILVRENAVLKNKLEQALAATPDTVQYLNSGTNYFYTPAHIVHSTHFKQFNYLTIDIGRKQGITSDMGVIGDNGIVGIVLESSANFSTIIPIINRDFRLSVKVKKSNFSGILQWEGDTHLEAELNEIPHHAKINIGDTIVTSGYSALFPENLLVGTIKDYSLLEGNFYDITIELATDYQRLFHVFVIKNFHQEEQRNIESTLD